MRGFGTIPIWVVFFSVWGKSVPITLALMHPILEASEMRCAMVAHVNRFNMLQLKPIKLQKPKRKKHTRASAPPPPPASPQYSFSLIDVCANLADPMFRGIYQGKSVHEDDFNLCLKRAAIAGVNKIIIAAGSENGQLHYLTAS